MDERLYILCGIPKSQSAKRGVFIIIHKTHKHKITDIEAIYESLIKDQPLFFGIYAISHDEPCVNKYCFFETLNEDKLKIDNTREISMLRDFKRRIGRRPCNK